MTSSYRVLSLRSDHRRRGADRRGRPDRAGPGAAAARVTSPKEQFGHEIGDDYVLPNYTQLTEYWKKLDARVRPHDSSSTSARPPKAATS